jgi:hypothetical protein
MKGENMKAQHTPGNWIAQHRHITVNHPSGENGLMLAIADFEEIDDKQGVKNCQLCAAAPELLHALRFLVDAANTEPGMSIYKAHIEQAKAAISKAESPA